MNTSDQILRSPQFTKIAGEMAAVGRFLADRGWSPATSSNYSTKIDPDHIALTRTGVDKFKMTSEDVIIVNRSGEVLAPREQRASAETLIHTTIYNHVPTAEAILHTHSPENTRLSLHFLNHGEVIFEGYEMQKGLEGNSTHEQKVHVPIVPNAQDMQAFSLVVEDLFRKSPKMHGFLIAGHGLYTWGSSLKLAQRQVETFEFLFRCLTLEMAGV